MQAHELRIETDDAALTVGTCTCGEWRREVSSETVAVTGRPREAALRVAHVDHVRDVLKPAPVPRVPP